MLILQRKKGQSIMIGDDIKLSITDISQDTVKIAIQAPRDVKILREELSEAAKANLEAVSSKRDVLQIKRLLHKEDE